MFPIIGTSRVWAELRVQRKIFQICISNRLKIKLDDDFDWESIWTNEKGKLIGGTEKKSDNINFWHSQNVRIRGEMYFF